MADEDDSFPATTQQQRRIPPKSHPQFNNYAFWKQKLRENCCRRVRDDRTRLIWRMRLPASQSAADRKGTIKEAFQDIVSDELKRLRDMSAVDKSKLSDFNCKEDEIIWEYDGLHDAYQGDCEEILLEMQRIFYEDLQFDFMRKGTEEYAETWDDEEDRYLAQAVLEHMQLNEDQVSKRTWCPICKQGQLQENNSVMFCSCCELKLKKSDEVNLDLLRHRLAEAHAEHLERDCRSKPTFSIDRMFDFLAINLAPSEKQQGCREWQGYLHAEVQRSNILVDLDHDEKDESVYDDHAEEDTQVDPLGPVDVYLEDILQDVLSGNPREIWRLVVKHQTAEIILVLPLDGRFRNVIGKPEVPGYQHEYPLTIVAGKQ